MRGLNAAEVKRFRKMVYDHYRERGRHDLPWRRTRDPYRILVSEFMLQQTQVPRVLEKYESFIVRFPDFASLDAAPLREVLRAWSGLGYNRRAFHLKEAARRVMADFNGALPSRPEELVTLPGIGRATAAAIAAFAFGAAHPFIETNIRAVFIHHFFSGRHEITRNGITDAELLPLVEQTIDRTDPRTWYGALMDYGSMLKGRLPNPARRSAHHTRHGAFEGSDRQARGLIVKALAERDRDETALLTETGLDAARLGRNLATLVREGMIARKRRRYGIAQ